MLTLRPYQENAIAAIKAAYLAGFKSPLYQLPTGGGKSLIFIEIATRAAARGKRVAICLHRKELIHQTVRQFQRMGAVFGVISPGFSFSRASLQIASIWTLAERLAAYPPFDLIIIDEAHHSPSETYARVFKHYANALKLSVTATPQRLDGRGLNDQCDTLITGPTMRELIRDGYLARPETFGANLNIDFSKVGTRMGDFIKEELEKLLDTNTITGSLVDHYRKLVQGAPAVGFGVSIRHCEHMAEQFRRAGFQAASIDGKMDSVLRNRMIDDVANRQLNVLFSCQLLTEGIDVPACQAVIDAAPTQSLTRYLQKVGRGMRPKPDKSPCLILDHVGNWARHGMVEDERQWSLMGRTKTKKQKAEEAAKLPVRICKGCYAVFRALLRNCPKCGRAVESEARILQESEGELVKLTPEERDAVWREERYNPANPVFSKFHQRIDAEWEKQAFERAMQEAAKRGVKGDRAAWARRIVQFRKDKIRRTQSA
jgi:DNA repair protein RadD